MEYFTRKEAYEIIADLIDKANPNAEVVTVLNKWAGNLKDAPYIVNELEAKQALVDYMHRTKMDVQSLVAMIWTNAYFSKGEYTSVYLANELEILIVFDTFVTLSDEWENIVALGSKRVKDVKEHLLKLLNAKIQSIKEKQH